MKSIKLNGEKLSFAEAVEKFYELNKEVAELKAKEMELRTAIVENYFDSENMEGTENIDLEDGYKLKCVKKLSRTFVTKDISEIESVLSKMPEALASNLVKYKPELSVSGFKSLEGKYKTMFEKLVVTKPSAPSLEIVVPKHAK